MMNEKPITVLHLPEKLVRGSAHLFFGEIQNLLKAERPRLVFDFSDVKKLDSAGVAMLLNCAEEVMKRNGDLKLAAVSPAPAAVLELTRVDGLREIFETVPEAVESFFHLPTFAGEMQWGATAHAESAA